jgi:hypothetical protein
MNDNIKQDLWSWITDFIEVNHEFYNFKFPPCPYAKSARLKGLVDVQVCDKNPFKFFNEQVDDIIAEQKFNVRLLAFPHYHKWNYLLHKYVKNKNMKSTKDNFYSQYGLAAETQSKFSGLFSGKPYFIVIINKLDDVLDAQRTLERTDYYKNWSEKHFEEVVVRRQKMFEKYSKKD